MTDVEVFKEIESLMCVPDRKISVGYTHMGAMQDTERYTYENATMQVFKSSESLVLQAPHLKVICSNRGLLFSKGNPVKLRKLMDKMKKDL